MDKVKMIWDFRGPNALHIASHHIIHLDEFIDAENIPNAHTGKTEVTENYSMAYLVVPATYTDELRKKLKPHRGQRYNP